LFLKSFHKEGEQQMADCEECDKKLGIFEGYRHPALGPRFLVCGRCYNKIEHDMKRWSEFCLTDAFPPESTKSDVQEAWDTKISDDPLLQKWFRNLWMKYDTLISEK
jgi:hypothetical protein